MQIRQPSVSFNPYMPQHLRGLGDETIRPVTVIEPFNGVGESPYMQEYGQYLSPFNDADDLEFEIQPAFYNRPGVRMAYALLGTASMAASAFHGYKRNQSIGWALWWGLMGATFPVITPTIALAQGFGETK